MPTLANFPIEVSRRGEAVHLQMHDEKGAEIGSASIEFGTSEKFEGDGYDYFADEGVIEEEGEVAVLTAIEVDSSHRGKGLGTVLLDKVEAIVAARRIPALYLHASNGTDEDPREFYAKRSGYEEAGEDSCGMLYFKKEIELSPSREGKPDPGATTERPWLHVCPNCARQCGRERSGVEFAGQMICNACSFVWHWVARNGYGHLP